MTVTIELIQSTTTEIEATDDRLTGLLGVFTDEQRRALARPPAAFAIRARAVIHEARRLTDATAFAGVNPANVESCLDRAEALDPAINAVERLLRRLQDGRLEAMNEAWLSTLNLYAVAQVRCRSDQTCRTIVEEMAPLFNRPNRSRSAADKAGREAVSSK